jgi:hypothetical protein
MRFFNQIINSSFKKDSNGRTVYFPFGIFGMGYIVSSENEKHKIEYFIKRILFISFSLIIGIGVGAGWIFSFLLLPIIAIWHYFAIKRITNTLELSNEKLIYGESLKQASIDYSFEKLWFLFILCDLVVLFCIIQIFFNSEAILICVLGIFTFLAGAIITFRMICIKKQLTDIP